MLESLSACKKAPYTYVNERINKKNTYEGLRKFHYTVTYSTNIRTNYTEENYVAFHYALKNNFIVKLRLSEQTVNIKEGEFFIAKKACNYDIVQYENNLTCIITFLLHKQYIEKELLNILNTESSLYTFLTNKQGLYANPNFANIPLSEKTFFDQVIDTLPLNDMSQEDCYLEFMKLTFKRILLFIDYHFQENRLEKIDIGKKVLTYIENNLADANMNGLASSLKYTETYLSEAITKQLGKNFKLLLRDARLAKAKELLITTDLTLAEICRFIGYENASTLITAFKQVYDDTPTNFRKNRRLQNI